MSKENIPPIALKAVKIHDDMSEETMCYSANIYLRNTNTKVGHTSNSGHGGSDNWRFTDKEAEQAVKAWLKDHPVDVSILGAGTPDEHVFHLPYDEESLFQELVSEYEIMTAALSVLKKKHSLALAIERPTGTVLLWAYYHPDMSPESEKRIRELAPKEDNADVIAVFKADADPAQVNRAFWDGLASHKLKMLERYPQDTKKEEAHV
jgi:hypothetical protein